ncbi:MAG TPA: fibronectin type III domain-containing protein [Spirochaetota bacterium]|nr:fibronectin type III domain-containing protein [Spirochaetota bacterium]
MRENTEHLLFSKIKKINLILLILFFMTGAVSSLRAEFIFLKDGSIIEGTITSDAADYLTLQTKDKKEKQITRSNILRILYTRLSLGKVYVQKRDGKGIEVYMVDEDQESWTFREDLYKPVEFKLKRTEVLFMAEKNPSGLEGEAWTDKIELKWLPPYNKIKHYTVYIKTSEKGKYEPVASTENLDTTIKKLKSNTTYWVIVTATDTDDYESLPSNELKITTKNILPDAPGIVSADNAVSTDGKTSVFRIKWKTGTDPDGKVIKYRLYGMKEGERVLIKEISTTEYDLADLIQYQSLELASVDDKGDESVASRIAIGKLFIGIHPAVIVPLGNFADLGEMGYGAFISCSYTGLWLENMVTAIDLGYFYITGKDQLESTGRKVNMIHMAPLMLRGGYEFRVTEGIALTPALSLGYAYTCIDYVYRYQITSPAVSKTSDGFDPIAAFSVSADWAFRYDMTMGVYASYGIIFEKDDSLGYASLGINFKVRF